MARFHSHVGLCVPLLAAALAIPAAGQRVKGEIRLTVEARRVKVLASDKEPQLHWVLQALPQSADISLLPGGAATPADESFRKALLRTVANVQRRCPGGVFVLDDHPECSISTALEDRYRRTGRRFAWEPPTAEIKSRPAAEGPSKTLNVGFQYTAGVSDDAGLIQRISVTVESSRFAGAPMESRIERKEQLAGLTLPGRLQPDAVDVTLRFAKADGYPGRPDSTGPPRFTDHHVESALTRVALSALEAAAEKNLVPDQDFVDPVLTELEQRLMGTWNLDPRSGWPRVVADVKRPGNTLEIKVSGVSLVRRADVLLRPGDVVAETRNGARELHGIRRRAAARVAERNRKLLDGLAGTVPARKEIDQVSAAIADDPELADELRVRAISGALIFWSNFRWISSELKAKINLDIAADPQRQFTAGGDITGDNLIYLVPKLLGRSPGGNLGEVHTFTAKGGDEFQTAQYDVSITRSLLGGQLVPAIGFDWRRDRNQRLGPGFTPVLQEVVRGIRPAVKWSRVSSEESAGAEVRRWSNSASLEFALPLRHTRIRPTLADAGDLINGQITAAAFDGRFTAGYDLSPRQNAPGIRFRAGRSGVTVHANSQRAMQFLAGDFSFWQHAFDADAALPFGFTRVDQFKLHYRRGMGVTGAGTPVFSLFRLGGADNLRGVEIGEYVGRGISYDQSEFAWNLIEPIQGVAAVIRKIRGTPARPAKPEEGDTAEPSPTLESFLESAGISNLFIKAFYDRGRVAETGLGIGDLLSLDGAPRGWGIGIELGGLRTPAGRVNLTIARARSSYSYVHPTAIWITGISIAF